MATSGCNRFALAREQRSTPNSTPPDPQENASESAMPPIHPLSGCHEDTGMMRLLKLLHLPELSSFGSWQSLLHLYLSHQEMPKSPPSSPDLPPTIQADPRQSTRPGPGQTEEEPSDPPIAFASHYDASNPYGLHWMETPATSPRSMHTTLPQQDLADRSHPSRFPHDSQGAECHKSLGSHEKN